MISVIIVNYKVKRHLKVCLDTLYEFNDKSKFEVIIVDDGTWNDEEHDSTQITEDFKDIDIKLIRIKPFQEVVTKEKIFEATGEEKTAFRFKTDKEGNIIDINELPANLLNPLGE